MSRQLRGSRLFPAGLVAVLMLVLTVAGVAAAPPTRDQLITLDAGSAFTCVVEADGTEVCTSTAILVELIDGETAVVNFYEQTQTLSPSGDLIGHSIREGQSVVSGTVVSVDKTLSALTLAPTTIDVETCAYNSEGECVPTGETGSVTVSATFSGTSELERFTSVSTSHVGPCIFRDRSAESRRYGTVTINVDGQSVQVEDATLVSRKHLSHTSPNC